MAKYKPIEKVYHTQHCDIYGTITIKDFHDIANANHIELECVQLILDGDNVYFSWYALPTKKELKCHYQNWLREAKDRKRQKDQIEQSDRKLYERLKKKFEKST